MSLTSQLKNVDTELARRLQLFRPKSRPDRKKPLLTPPRSKRYSMVATAFDYLLRFELERVAPHAVTRRWTAEGALDLICYPSANGTLAGLGVRVADSDELQAGDLPRLADKARAVIARAKESVYDYVAEAMPDPDLRRVVAKHAIRLARLDPVVRTGHLDQEFETAPAEDVDDLLRMLDVTPVDDLVDSSMLLLDPPLGESAVSLGGTEVSLIAGDLLVDIRIASRSAVQPVLLDQLLAHVLLCRNRHHRHPEFPDVRRAGLLFPRQGYLWTFDVAEWEEQSGFDEMEKWLREELEGPREPRKANKFKARKYRRIEKWLGIDWLRRMARRYTSGKRIRRKIFLILYFVLIAIVVLLVFIPR